MGNKLGFLLVLIVAAGGLSLLPSAGADDGETATAPLWVFDLQVVQTTCDAETGMTASPWEGSQGPAVELKFEDALATLKKRGTIFLLMDQRVTSVEGVACEVKQESNHPTERMTTKNAGGEQHQLTNTTYGCTAKLEAYDDGLNYSIEGKWSLWPQRRRVAVPTARVSWMGTHPPLDGKTLVLHHRDHNLQEGGQPQITEVYCFLTARKVAR